MIMHNPNQILTRKMELESKWNRLFLENNRVTPEMNAIHEEIRDCRRQLVSISDTNAKYDPLNFQDDFLNFNYA